MTGVQTCALPICSRFTYIPYGTSAATPAATLASQLLANAGRYNLDLAPSVLRGYESTLAHVTRKQSGMARIDHRLGSRVSLFADFAFQRSSLIDSFWVPLGNGNYQFAVPGNAPTNPFRENVLVSIPIPASQASRNDISNQSANAVLGAVVKLPGDWRAAADCNYSVSAQKVFYDLMNLANATTFGGNATLLYNGTINPFVDTLANPIDFPRWYGDWTGYNKDTMLDYNLRASGPLFSLPGGPPTLTVGTEIYTERLPQAYVGGTFPPFGGAAANPTNQHSYFIGQRISTYSAHAELSVPVVSGRNELRFIRALELQAAVRTEEFHVYTNPDGRINVFPDAVPPRITHSATESRQDIARLRATKPTLGLKWEPLPAVTVRASYAEAFLPPTFSQLTQRIPFEVPSSLVEREMDRRVEEFVRRLMDQGIDPRKVLGRADFRCARADTSEAVNVRCERTLQRQNADNRVHLEASRSRENRSPTALCVALVDLVHADAGHGRTETPAHLGEDARVTEVRGGLDDRLGARRRVVALEDARPHEDRLGTQLHGKGRIGRCRDSAGAENRNREPARLGDLLDQRQRSLQLLGPLEQFGRICLRDLPDVSEDGAQVPHRLDDVAGTGLALRTDHARALGHATQRLAQVRGPADEGNRERELVDVVRLVGRGEDLGLVDEVDSQRLEDLGLDEMSDACLGHDRNLHGGLDALDHLRVTHSRDATVTSEIGRAHV